MIDDDDSNHPLGAGLSSLIRLSGVNIPARARFVGEAVVSATLSSITLGLCWGALGSMTPMGPLVPFLVGSAAGYSFGVLHYWAGVKRTTLWYAQQYPTILVHALRTERHIIVPQSVVKASQERILRTRTQRQQFRNAEEEVDVEQQPPNSIVKTTTSGVLTLDQWILQGGLGRLTWSVLAAQQCRGDVDAIQRQERQKLVDTVVSPLDDDDDGDENSGCV